MIIDNSLTGRFRFRMQPDNVIYHYQTLITGIGALLAAVVAGWPVWRQLRMMRTQSEAMLRDIIVQRIKETEGRSKRLQELTSKLRSVREELYHFSWSEEKPNEHWAHSAEQVVSSVQSALKVWFESNRDIEKIEAAKKTLTVSFGALIDKLNEIWWPAANVQVDEDHNIPDHEWSRIERRSEEAKDEVSDDMRDAFQALTALGQAYRDHLTALNTRLRTIDDRLIGERANMSVSLWIRRKLTKDAP